MNSEVTKLLLGYVKEIKKDSVELDNKTKLQIIDEMAEFFDSGKKLEPHLRDSYHKKFFKNLISGMKKYYKNIKISINSNSSVELPFYSLDNEVLLKIENLEGLLVEDYYKFISGFIASLMNSKKSLRISVRISAFLAVICGNLYINTIAFRDNDLKLDDNKSIVYKLFQFVIMNTMFDMPPIKVIKNSDMTHKMVGDISLEKSLYDMVTSREFKMDKIEDIHEILIKFGLIQVSNLKEGLVRSAKMFGPLGEMLLDFDNPQNIPASLLYCYLNPKNNTVINKYSGLGNIIERKAEILKMLLDSIQYTTFR